MTTKTIEQFFTGKSLVTVSKMEDSKEISNAELTLAELPSPGSVSDVIAKFASTFNGYKQCGSFEACAEIANARRHNTLTELRACLFFEQRRWRHFGETPDAEAETYQRSLVEGIRMKVVNEDRG